jgi:HEAT repeat protein
MLALQTQGTRYARAQTHDDAQVLATRICGELARRGDADCAAKVRVEADKPCSEESKDMKLAALNAVQNMDPEQALPLLRGVLSRRDNCSADLRRKAVFLIADQNTPKAADILIDVVHSDPDQEVRREAVWWLSEVHGDRAVALLDSIARSSQDEELRSKAIEALAEQGDARSRRALRQLIEQPGVSEDAKAHAILALGQFGRPTPEEGAYLRQQYASLKSERLKQKVIESLGNIEDDESRRWLLALAQNSNEGIELRKQALFWAAQSKRASSELIPLYEKLREPEMKEQLIFVYSNVDDKASTDKLIEIARKEPNRELRKKAIFWLGQKDDPRVQQILMEIINQ